MPDRVMLFIDQRAVLVPSGITVAAALCHAGAMATRRSRTGEPRGPLCGMGICHECRVTIDGVGHQRGCQIPCRDGMKVSTDA
jgi:D-hydroxyproline dehydrogenase subunit gamma